MSNHVWSCGRPIYAERHSFKLQIPHISGAPRQDDVEWKGRRPSAASVCADSEASLVPTRQLYAIIYFFCWNILCIWMHMSHVHTSLSVVPKKLNCCGRRSSQEYWRSWELQGSEVTAVRFIHAFDIDVCHFVNNKSAHIQLGYTGYTRYIHIHIHIHTHKTGLYLWKPNPGSFDSNMVRQRIVPSTCGDHPQMLHHGFCHNSTKRGKLL